MKGRRISILQLVFSLIGGLILLFIILPIAYILLGSSGAELVNQATDSEVQAAITNSLSLSVATAALACLLGVPLAYLLARKRFFGVSIIEGIIDLPLAVPHTVAGIALLSVFGRRAFVGSLMTSMFGLEFMGTRLAIVFAMLFVSLPYMVNSAREGIEAISPRLEQVGRTLGATEWQVFARITLPLTKRSIFTGFVLTWARAISEFGAVVIVAYHPITAPVKIWDAFTTRTLRESSAVAALLLFITLAMFILFRFLAYRRK